jgi:hypothetical protein
MFVKKPRVALQTILRSTTRANASTTLPTDVSLLRDETSSLLVTTPAEVVTKLAQIEGVALSPDPTLPPGAPFPWLDYVRPAPTSSVPMTYDRIIPAIMRKALSRSPNHKAAGPDGVRGLVLKNMPPDFHEALHLMF